jgi:hypothetical protein
MSKTKCYYEQHGRCCFSVAPFWWFLCMKCLFVDPQKQWCRTYYPEVVEGGEASPGGYL